MGILRAAPFGIDRQSSPGHTNDQSGAFQVRKPRVLVVDVDSGVARQLALALEIEGVETLAAKDGDEALALLADCESVEHPVDLVLVELMLPRRSGLELARDIRARYPDLRIVLTGAYHLSERQLARAGCNAIAFVPKPCEPSVVAAFVKTKVRTSE